MKYPLLLLAVCTVFIHSCRNDKGGNMQAFLNRDHLNIQSYMISIDRDTMLLTEKGCIIKIPKGSLASERNTIKLEVKEAVTATDIVLSGLTTMSGNQPLNSGGMIYINAAEGYKVEIKKQLEVLIPTKKYNPGMQVFKGEEKNDGSIDWTEPAPLPNDETLTKIESGAALFKANCASCHKIDKDFTAPRLLGITDRRSKQWLYAFTRNPMKLIEQGYYTEGKDESINTDSSKSIIPDFYSACLAHKWYPTVMTSFPQLSDTALDALYAYIKAESDKLPKPPGTGLGCCDSCDIYGKAAFAASGELRNFRQAQENLFNLDRTIPVPRITNGTALPGDTLPPTRNANEKIPELVTRSTVKATYYTINVKAFGWYNVDILMMEDSKCQPSELFVRIQGAYEIDLNVVLVIPSVKAFIEGGKLKDGKHYGFYETDGKIPLPPNEQCYIMAFGEYKGKVIFGKTAFTAQSKQTITVSTAETSKQLMQAAIKALDLDGVELDLKKVIPQTEKEKSLDKKMEEAQKLRPKNCDCVIGELAN